MHSSATPAQWLEGARPHTWANAYAPVIAGSAAAGIVHSFHLGRALLAAVVALALIIGVNYANDYSDGIRGTDEDRTGPLRLTGSGLVSPPLVKRAAFISFGVAGVAGVILSLLSAWWLILVGLLCVLAAWYYTGGKNPYGYRGLGEVSVFIFFGLVAVLGTQFTQAGQVTWVGLLCAITIGAVSSGVNLTNNLRDIPTDRASGKITLAVRLGDATTRKLLVVLLLVPLATTALIAVLAVNPFIVIICLVGPAALQLRALRTVRTAQGRALIPALGFIGRYMLVWSILLATSVALGSWLMG